MPIKLAALTDPQIELELSDGSAKSYSLYDVAQKVEEGIRKLDTPTIAGITQVLRDAFGLPDLTHYQAQFLYAEITSRIDNLDITKKLLGRSQNSAASTPGLPSPNSRHLTTTPG